MLLLKINRQYKQSLLKCALQSLWRCEFRHENIYKTNVNKEVRNLSEAIILGMCSLLENGKWADVFCETDVVKNGNNHYTILDHYFIIAWPLLRKKLTHIPNTQARSNKLV
jgi:hypothetical protein